MGLRIWWITFLFSRLPPCEYQGCVAVHCTRSQCRCSQALRLYFSPQMWPSLTSTRSEWIVNTANTEVLGMVSFELVRLHRAISSSVLKWHWMNPVGSLTVQCWFSISSLHVSCCRGFVAGGPGHVAFRFLQSGGSSPHRGGQFLLGPRPCFEERDVPL